MNRNLICSVFIICALFFASCKKGESQLGTESIRGQLRLNDSLIKGVGDSTLANKTVKIQYVGADKTDFIFSVQTDADGYFVFEDLLEPTDYTVYYEETIDGVKYSAFQDVKAPDYRVVLGAKIDIGGQTGIILNLKDQSGNVLKGAKICLYASDQSPGYLKGNCEGSSRQATTDARGNASLVPLPADDYYMVATYTSGSIQLVQRSSFTISNKVEQKNVQLDTLPNNSVTFTVADQSGNILKDAKICIFTSENNAGYLAGSCEGNSRQLTTDLSGKAVLVNPEKLPLYFVSNAEVGGRSFSAKGTFTPTDKATTVKINLQSPNGIHFRTVDADGNSIGNVELCVFNSARLFTIGECELSNFKTKTNEYGVVSHSSMPKATYYILGRIKVGEQQWESRDTVSVSDDLVVKTLVLR